ncbi:50S ribosomal protein L33 [Aerococcaceae bacterium DSM 111176]|nr:50S ribosomal protein L33 [Aerococcaceae bacterium DSM 111176]
MAKQRKGALACTVCGQRNYSMTPTQTGQTTRLEVKKFCKYCNKHTLHKETK